MFIRFTLYLSHSFSHISHIIINQNPRGGGGICQGGGGDILGSPPLYKPKVVVEYGESFHLYYVVRLWLMKIREITCHQYDSCINTCAVLTCIHVFLCSEVDDITSDEEEEEDSNASGVCVGGWLGGWVGGVCMPVWLYCWYDNVAPLRVLA